MSEWVKNIGKCPVSAGTLIDVKLVGYTEINQNTTPEEWCWNTTELVGCVDVWRQSVGIFPVTTKDTNPKTSAGDLKIPLHLFPTTAIAAGAMAFHEGRMKYGAQNWRVKGVRYSVYHSALLRHVMSAWEGETIDPESGIPHLAKAIACLAILIDSEAAGMLTDDRCVQGGYEGLVKQLTPSVKAISEMHSEKSPKHYSIQDNNAI